MFIECTVFFLAFTSVLLRLTTWTVFITNIKLNNEYLNE